MSNPVSFFIANVKMYMPMLLRLFPEDVMQEAHVVSSTDEVPSAAYAMAKRYGLRYLNREGKRRWLRAERSASGCNHFLSAQTTGRTKPARSRVKIRRMVRCAFCSTEFQPSRCDAKFCTRSCQDSWHNMKKKMQRRSTANV